MLIPVDAEGNINKDVSCMIWREVGLRGLILISHVQGTNIFKLLLLADQ